MQKPVGGTGRKPVWLKGERKEGIGEGEGREVTGCARPSGL